MSDNIRISPPRTRTILYCETDPYGIPVGRSTYRRFEFPEILFHLRENLLFALIENDRKCYRFPFFNVRLSGSVCLPRAPIDIEDGIDLFWTSAFTDNVSGDSGQFWLNSKIGAISFRKWERMTEEDPGFMAREFDANYLATGSRYIWTMD